MRLIIFSFKAPGRRSLLLTLGLILLLVMPVVSAVSETQQNDVNKRKVIRQVAANYIQVGKEQLKRGLYKEAEKAFLYALDYRDYLTDSELAKLTELLEKAHVRSVEKTDVKGQKDKLTEAEKLKSKKKPSKMRAEISDKTKQKLIDEAFEPGRGTDLLTGQVQQAKITASQPAAGQASYINVINRKSNVLHSYTKAVVEDAVVKANNHISQGEFDKAMEVVAAAERTVNQNRLHLGDDNFKYYSDQLSRLSDEIQSRQITRKQQLSEQKKAEAIEAQRTYRQQVDIERSKRIAELMENSKAYQRQQRYEQALGQLESLLALDPHNDEALVLKQTLADTINLRKQLELQKIKSNERVSTLLDTEESSIPYGQELHYPKNWREISATRKPEEPLGRDPCNLAVYKQLAQTVDLSELSRQMPFSEALEIIRDSVVPPLKMFVNWRDLETAAEIDQLTPINMDPIPSLSLRTGLKLLLESVSAEWVELGYIVEDGVLTIATKDRLPSEWEIQVYDITDLLSRPAEYFAPSGETGGGGEASEGVEGFQDEEEISPEELGEEALERALGLVELIQDTVEPDSWEIYGGEGTISAYGAKKLIVRQQTEVHAKIDELFSGLRKALGHQVSIEARYLLVGENFLEDIGLDLDFSYNAHGRTGIIEFDQASSNIVFPETTGVPGTFGGVMSPLGGIVSGTVASTITGGFGNLLLNDLEVSYLIRATQAHRDASSLTAPKVTVLSGESASIRNQRLLPYPGDYEWELTEIGDTGEFYWTVDTEENTLTLGSILNITPTIMPDRKHVLLNIVTQLVDFLGFESYELYSPVGTSWTVEWPASEVSQVQTRVSVPDTGTLLLGGQKVVVEQEIEAGVPVLSKVPFIGRLFSNRAKIRDEKILLILVKPTIILQEEAEAKALAAVDGF
ncbi:MAG: hypothetical protein JXB29_10445 [Sedimentisphaerales bacterium]|nr:hypothetical protein [Sedimentisphaerales bacterium]